MNFVVDANILFSILIKKGKTEDIMFNEEVHVFAPEFIFEEFSKYTTMILEKTERRKEEFEELLNILKMKIKTVPNEETKKYLLEASRICPDKNDIEYFALALKLHCPIWSQDKELRQQSAIKIYSTEELSRMFQQP